MLLYGDHRTAHPADAQHPLGHGCKLYFWSFIVALLIFALGAGVSLYEGVQHILDPAPIIDSHVVYIVQSKGLLIGEPASRETRELILEIAREHGSVRVEHLLTIHPAPRQIIAALTLDFPDDRRASAIERDVAGLEAAIKHRCLDVRALFIRLHHPSDMVTASSTRNPSRDL